MKKIVSDLVNSRKFEISITLVILSNSILIGVETYNPLDIYHLLHKVFLGILTIEIIMR
jgi:voltage-gated sodium channel